MNKTLIFAVGAVALMACYVGISFYVKRYVKSVADFWVMGRQAKWWMFTGTLCATYVSMWTFLAGVGLAWGWGPLSPMLFYTSSLTFGWIIATVLLGLRLRRMQCNSVTEFFEKRFGTNPGYFYTGLSIALAGSLFFYLLLQIQGTGIILSTIFSLPMSVSILIIVVILIISLDAAGMWSVVASDTFSCLIFIIVAIFVLPITISSVGGLETGIAAVNAQNLWSATGASKLNMTYFLGYALSWLAIVGGSPHIINRSLVVDTPKSVLKGTFVGYILTIILTVVRFHSGSLLVAKIAPNAMPVDSSAPVAALYSWPLWLG
ncbi:MAG: hypothetical protein RBT20_04400, partial [Syntrophales bacterium]|nr:hypothetical protein [Syntrophales bacterium]